MPALTAHTDARSNARGWNASDIVHFVSFGNTAMVTGRGWVVMVVLLVVVVVEVMVGRL